MRGRYYCQTVGGDLRGELLLHIYRLGGLASRSEWRMGTSEARRESNSGRREKKVLKFGPRKNRVVLLKITAVQRRPILDGCKSTKILQVKLRVLAAVAGKLSPRNEDRCKRYRPSYKHIIYRRHCLQQYSGFVTTN